MRRPERIVVALRALGEPRQTAALPQRPHPLATPRQDLVRISLVPDIPDDPVVGRVEHVVQRHRQLDHTQTRAEMPPVTDTASIISDRTASATERRSLSGSKRSADVSDKPSKIEGDVS